MNTLFLIQSKTFPTITNSTYTIDAISAKINNSKEVLIGSTDPISFELIFHSKVGEEYIVKEVVVADLYKAYGIPQLGKVEILSGLFSSNKETIYQMASIVTAYYGYELLPLEDQIYL